MITRPLYLSNDHNIKRLEITSDGVTVNAVAARGLISLTEHGAAIHSTLEVAGTIAAGDFLATIQGYDLDTQLLALWDAADVAGTKLYVYERVIVDTADYGDVVRLRVERDRPPIDPDADL